MIWAAATCSGSEFRATSVEIEIGDAGLLQQGLRLVGLVGVFGGVAMAENAQGNHAMGLRRRRRHRPPAMTESTSMARWIALRTRMSFSFGFWVFMPIQV